MLKYLKPQKINSRKVRLGNNCDGGYVISQLVLEKCSALFTYGCGTDISFENDFTAKYNKPAYMFDHTINKENWDLGHQHFRNEGLGGSSCKKEAASLFLTLKERREEIINALENVFSVHDKINAIKAHEVCASAVDITKKIIDTYNVKTPRQHYDQLGISGDILLKIDTEGAEFDYFLNEDIDDLASFVGGIILEVHWLEHPENQEYASKIMEMLDKHFVLVHLHGNNWGQEVNYQGYRIPSVPELSFVNRRLISDNECIPDTSDYPIPGLDYPNTGSKPECDMSFLKSI